MNADKAEFVPEAPNSVDAVAEEHPAIPPAADVQTEPAPEEQLANEEPVASPFVADMSAEKSGIAPETSDSVKAVVEDRPAAPPVADVQNEEEVAQPVDDERNGENSSSTSGFTEANDDIVADDQTFVFGLFSRANDTVSDQDRTVYERGNYKTHSILLNLTDPSIISLDTDGLHVGQTRQEPTSITDDIDANSVASKIEEDEIVLSDGQEIMTQTVDIILNAATGHLELNVPEPNDPLTVDEAVEGNAGGEADEQPGNFKATAYSDVEVDESENAQPGTVSTTTRMAKKKVEWPAVKKIAKGKKLPAVPQKSNKRQRKSSSSKGSSTSTSGSEDSDQDQAPECRLTRAQSKKQPISTSTPRNKKKSPAKKKARKQSPPPPKKKQLKSNGKRSREPSTPKQKDKKYQNGAGNIKKHCKTCGMTFIFNRKTGGKKIVKQHSEVCESASPEWHQAFMAIFLEVSNGSTECISGKGLETRLIVKEMMKILNNKMSKLAKLMAPTLKIMVAVLKDFERLADLRQSTLDVSRDDQTRPLKINDLLLSGSSGLISAMEFAGMIVAEAPNEEEPIQRANEQAHRIMDNVAGATEAITQIKKLKDLADNEKTFLDEEMEKMVDLVEKLHELIALDGFAQEAKILQKIKEFRGKKGDDKDDDDPPAPAAVPLSNQTTDVKG